MIFLGWPLGLCEYPDGVVWELAMTGIVSTPAPVVFKNFRLVVFDTLIIMNPAESENPLQATYPRLFR